MSRVPRVLIVTLGLLCCALSIRPMSGAELERGAAIMEPFALRELDHGRFGLGRVLAPARPADTPLTNDQLFALPSMAPVRNALNAEYDSYVAKHRAARPDEKIGVGSSFDLQVFDYPLLTSPDTRFVLAGIVNRLDRSYVAAANCGEVRLIYRLTRLTPPPAVPGDEVPSPRLPMTLNVVLKAKADAADGGGQAVTCADIAGRWLAAGELSVTGAELAARLTAKDGPLDLIRPENIHRIETNLQIAHMPKTAAREFRTDYLMNVFDYDAQSGAYQLSPLENQIDRERLLEDDKLRRDFRAWLLDPAHFRELDRGTILIPDRFLATSAIAATPVGFSPSDLQPAFGLVQGDTSAVKPAFEESDIVTALQTAAANGGSLENIRSVAGFERRLNDWLLGNQTTWRVIESGQQLWGAAMLEANRRSKQAQLRLWVPQPRWARVEQTLVDAVLAEARPPIATLTARLPGEHIAGREALERRGFTVVRGLTHMRLDLKA